MRFITDALKIIFGGIIGAAIVWLFGANFRVMQSKPSSGAVEMSYADLAAVNLTAATIALGAVAVVVTIAAVFGFQVIRSDSVSAAERRVGNDLPTLLETELGRMERDGRLTSALARAIYSGDDPNEDNNDTPIE